MESYHFTHGLKLALALLAPVVGIVWCHRYITARGTQTENDPRPSPTSSPKKHPVESNPVRRPT